MAVAGKQKSLTAEAGSLILPALSKPLLASCLLIAHWSKQVTCLPQGQRGGTVKGLKIDRHGCKEGED